LLGILKSTDFPKKEATFCELPLLIALLKSSEIFGLPNKKAKTKKIFKIILLITYFLRLDQKHHAK
jgi:hypothetical protein